MRQQLYELEHENIDGWGSANAVSRGVAARAVFAELVATCTANHWSREVVSCFVASVKAESSNQPRPTCMKEPASHSAAAALGDAETRVFTQLLGPSTVADDLEKAGAAAEERVGRWEQRKRLLVEPRVPIPARYTSLAWFSGPSSPAWRTLRGQLPECAQAILFNISGYYQAGFLGGGPSLIAVFGAVDRDAAEACLQEAIARIVPGARLERDGALTRLITTQTVGYLGWARDDTIYWNPDRATVVEAVEQKTTIASNSDVSALLRRVDRTKHAWFVLAGDVTSKLIGVRSTGARFATDLFEDHREHAAAAAPRLPVTIEFASAADAKRAAAAIRAPHPFLSRPLSAQLAKLAPVVQDRDIELDLVTVFSRPELFEEMRAAIERVKRQ